MKRDVFEVNFDGIVGLTHNYSGLSWGNVASLKHRYKPSHPKKAALQGLKKMLTLHELGVKQAVLPPHERPHIPTLRSLGYTGKNEDILKKVSRENFPLLLLTSSSAFMWAANSCIQTPSSDTQDGKVHITPANLFYHFHRSIEATFTRKVLQKIFSDESAFTVHSPLPQGFAFSDEGAANHSRICQDYGEEGLHLFVYGRSHFHPRKVPKRYPARQTLEAMEAIQRRHGIKHVIFAQQNPTTIDQGVFHNDVISVGNKDLFLYHEKAFVNTPKIIQELRQKADSLKFFKVSDISIEKAVKTYLFNSQIISLPDRTMALIAPKECENDSQVSKYIKTLPFTKVIYLNLRESMQNGGGPACLRVRMVLSSNEIKKMHQGVLFTNDLYKQLTQWVNKHYRDTLSPKELSDPKLLSESELALDELTQILKLDSLYSFQN